MNRNMRDGDVGRMRQMGSGGYGNLGGSAGYGSKGGNYGGKGLLGSNPSLMASGRGSLGFSMGGGNMDMDTLLQQRQLQQQLSLRESQLALANSLLQHQSHMMEGPNMGLHGGGIGGLGMGGLGMGGGMAMSKRRQDQRHSFSDYQPDYKRSRRDYQSPPRNRDRRKSRDHEVVKSSSTRKNQNSSSSRPNRTQEQDAAASKSKAPEEYDPEKPTSDSEGEKKNTGGSEDRQKDASSTAKEQKYFCHVCNIGCRDEDDFRRHMNSAKHKKRMVDVLSVHQEKSSQLMARLKAEEHLRKIEVKDKSGKGFCKICDQVLQIRYADHIRQLFHRKRAMQVTRGCGWCHVDNFSNFSEVLAHRETSEHKKNQALYEKNTDRDSKDQSRDSRSRFVKDDMRKSDKDRRGRDDKGRDRRDTDNEIKVQLPPELVRFDPAMAVGQSCIVPVTGFFCKLCNKFYNNETAAKETHCKTETHFTKYKKFIFAKLKAKALAEHEAAKLLKEKSSNEEGSVKTAKEDGSKGQDDPESKEETSRANGSEDEKMEHKEEEKEENIDGEEMEEGFWNEDDEKDDNVMLEEDSQDMMGMDDPEDDPIEDDSILDVSHESVSYATANDETAGDSTVNKSDNMSTRDNLSLFAGNSTSEFLQESQNEDFKPEVQITINLSGDEGDEEKAPAPAPATSTPDQSRGGAQGGGTNKARRGRKMKK